MPDCAALETLLRDLAPNAEELKPPMFVQYSLVTTKLFARKGVELRDFRDSC